MNVAGTEYNLEHHALEIYLSGCHGPHCEGCHNAELWDFNVGITWDEWFANNSSKCLAVPLVQQIWILGGEPQDQDDEELLSAVTQLRELLDSKAAATTIMLWTRYKVIREARLNDLIDYVKVGAYHPGDTPHKDMFDIELASDNQHIILGGRDDK